MKIKLIVTGGTFDKEYNELTGELYFNESHVAEMLQLGRSRLNLNIVPLMMRDSLNMTNDDVQVILDACLHSEEEKIVITHGTDRMVNTARALGQALRHKTVVLTGAMIPYAFGSSDGMFNLGSALAFVQTLSNGVYIVMNGRYFHYNNVHKNKKNGTFEEMNVTIREEGT